MKATSKGTKTKRALDHDAPVASPTKKVAASEAREPRDDCFSARAADKVAHPDDGSATLVGTIIRFPPETRVPCARVNHDLRHCPGSWLLITPEFE